MGIQGLWSELGDGEVRHIADYAAEHFKQHGRPLRIAIDEACFRFRNLTTEQVAAIREDVPEANPTEKTVLWKILRLWRRNIQLLFIWDGPSKPGKKRMKGKRGGGLVGWDKVKELHRLFEHMGVVYYRAPGEAEAECSRLQALGVVDAVWSDDCDSFMFGCTTLIRAHKHQNRLIEDMVRVYRTSDLQEKLDFDQDSYLMCAMVAGGDYHDGITGAGAGTSRVTSRKADGLATRLRHLTEVTRLAWREDFEMLLRTKRKSVVVPWNFPEIKVLDKYRRPTVSSDAELLNLRWIANGWEREIDHETLLKYLREFHNFHSRQYRENIAPVMLIRALMRHEPQDDRDEWQQRNSTLYKVERKRTVQRKAANGEVKVRHEVGVKFFGHLLAGISLQCPEEENWEIPPIALNKKLYNPKDKIDCEVHPYFLEYGLMAGSYETPKKQSKRKASGPEATSPPPTPTSSARSSAPRTREADSSLKTTTTSPQSNAQAKKRKRGDGDCDGDEAASPLKKPTKRKRKQKEAVKRTPSPAPRKFIVPRQLPGLPSIDSRVQVFDISDDNDDDGDGDGGSEDRHEALLNHMHTRQPPSTSAWPEYKARLKTSVVSSSTIMPHTQSATKLSKHTATPLVPGEVADAEMVRRLRNANFLGGLKNTAISAPAKDTALPNAVVRSAASCNIIDLTL